MQINLRKLMDAANHRGRVQGSTHLFYRYPAGFSPEFARVAIEQFTEPGDLVLDPFAGGGTTMVESRVLGRRSVGFDINPLAYFVSKVKTTLLTSADTESIRSWHSKANSFLRFDRKIPPIDQSWIDQGYTRHLDSSITWRIRKLITLILYYVKRLDNDRQKDFVKCAALRTAKWALDNRRTIPTVEQFRIHFQRFLVQMLNDASAYSFQIRSKARSGIPHWNSASTLYNQSSVRISTVWNRRGFSAPKLIVTSPPYPGIHVLYNRWQIQGRRETPAPYWIAGMVDGLPPREYTFADRHDPDSDAYFKRQREILNSLALICDYDTIMVQLVSFSNPRRHLSRFKASMNDAGFEEVELPIPVRHLWRQIPNRRWYTHGKGQGKECLLVHRFVG